VAPWRISRNARLTGEGPTTAQGLCGYRAKVRFGNSGSSCVVGLLLRWKAVFVIEISAGGFGRGLEGSL